MVVYNAIVTAEQGGTFGRPDTKVPQTKNLYLVGDWVGPEGLLADASFASAKRAAEQILKAQASLPYCSNSQPQALTNPASTSKG